MFSQHKIATANSSPRHNKDFPRAHLFLAISSFYAKIAENLWIFFVFCFAFIFGAKCLTKHTHTHFYTRRSQQPRFILVLFFLFSFTKRGKFSHVFLDENAKCREATRRKLLFTLLLWSQSLVVFARSVLGENLVKRRNGRDLFMGIDSREISNYKISLMWT